MKSFARDGLNITGRRGVASNLLTALVHAGNLRDTPFSKWHPANHARPKRASRLLHLFGKSSGRERERERESERGEDGRD